MAVRTLLLIILFSFSYTIAVSAEVPLKAAFIRGHQLWIKEQDKEVQLTKGKYVYFPQWSKDGRFIAYLAGNQPSGKTYLYIYDSKKKKSYQPYPAIESSNFQFFEVPIDANLHPDKIKHFYTIQTNTPDLFAINAEYFKWSADGKWVSFLAMPTASWSNDSNTLCVLSSAGDHFQVIGKMLWYKNWIKWAPIKNQLAFISGEGRFFVENKNTTVTDIPTLNERKEYTPQGYVDLDIEWLSTDKVIVARTKENKAWKEGPVPTMLTSLYVINIKSGEQKQITFPKKNELDRAPQAVGSNITWYRKTEKEKQGDVWIKDGINGPEHRWIRNVDSAPTFFH